jgi:hypothetical protein
MTEWLKNQDKCSLGNPRPRHVKAGNAMRAKLGGGPSKTPLDPGEYGKQAIKGEGKTDWPHMKPEISSGNVGNSKSSRRGPAGQG